MRQHSGGVDPGPDDEVRVPPARVRSQMRGLAIPMPPRTLGVALVVGLLAFLAGVQLAPAGGKGTAVTVATPAPTGSPTPTLTPASPTLPDRSRFATTFDPTALAVHAGLACIGGSNASYGAGRTYLIVSGRCPVPAQQQPALILKLEGEISTAIRATAITRDGGFAGGSGPNSNGATVMSWDYRSDGFEGSVYLVATRAGSDVQLVIILTEQIPA